MRLIRKVFILTSIIFIFQLSISMGEENTANDKVDISSQMNNLKSKKLHEKLSAIHKLSKLRDPKVTKELLKEMKSEKNPHIKAKIAEALSNSQDKSAYKEIENLLKIDADTEVRFSAAYSLGYAKDKSVIPSLIEAFLNEKENVGVRMQAANALTNYPFSEEIYKCFAKGLENSNPVIRLQAVTSLSFANTDKNKIIPLIQAMLKDKEAIVRNASKERLEFLGIK